VRSRRVSARGATTIQVRIGCFQPGVALITCDSALGANASSRREDNLDVFADPDIARTTVVTSNWVSAGGKGEDPAAAAHR